ncbi:hypothetical protein UFOVP247_191 [uncultured Caudovirales phage]|uniref:Uncharacterized protein n=1 Tax=uncultured Caudovirales phage TaxID=2100421 RepID=A0A6J7WU80_9CAUD|nr:hypothetical protein UFOVP247_191 [uncultured Caudovirales phage]
MILFIYAGPMSNGDSVSLTNVSNFSSQKTCEVAGETAKSLAAGTYKVARYSCVEVK